MSQTILQLQNIEKSFDGTPVLRGISLDAAAGEFITLLGSSGCGKTTTLRIIAGLECPDAGRVLLEGRDVTGTPPEKRDVNTVFQNYALFPHMTVAANIGYSLKLRRRPNEEIAKAVAQALELVQLTGYENRMPAQLSGGQKQRVAIARVLANEPEVILCDEATSALDPETTQTILKLLKNIRDTLGITIVVITHEMRVIQQVCTRVAVLDGGLVQEEGCVADIFAHPASRAAKRLLLIEDEEEESYAG